MGFEVHVLVALKSPPNGALMTALDHQFDVASHEVGTKTVRISEHVSVSSEADAVEFVRALVLDAIPAGSKIAEITSESA
jgi:hypothetical protein